MTTGIVSSVLFVICLLAASGVSVFGVWSLIGHRNALKDALGLLAEADDLIEEADDIVDARYSHARERISSEEAMRRMEVLLDTDRKRKLHNDIGTLITGLAVPKKRGERCVTS